MKLEESLHEPASPDTDEVSERNLYFIYRPIIVGNTTFMFLICVGLILHLITGLTGMLLISDNAFLTRSNPCTMGKRGNMAQLVQPLGENPIRNFY